MMNARFLFSVGTVVAAIVIGATCGCESATGTHSLTVTPSFVDLSTGVSGTSSNSISGTQTFTVSDDSLRELSLPLEWRVSNPTLGRIGAAGGTSASYIRTTAHGDNSIIVKDQYGAEGIATVRQ